jgi:hypothetical protein
MPAPFFVPASHVKGCSLRSLAEFPPNLVVVTLCPQQGTRVYKGPSSWQFISVGFFVLLFASHFLTIVLPVQVLSSRSFPSPSVHLMHQCPTLTLTLAPLRSMIISWTLLKVALMSFLSPWTHLRCPPSTLPRRRSLMCVLFLICFDCVLISFGF